jgi:hypothetical protein
MTTMRDALDRAMRASNDHEMWKTLGEDGVAVADQDSMSRAIHDVFCGINADHEHPNEKDQNQARALIAALQGRGAVSTIP